MAIATDPRFAHLEHLIATADSTMRATNDLCFSDPRFAAAKAEADAADAALGAFVRDIEDTTPPTLTTLALQARTRHYFHEGFGRNEFDEGDVALVASVLALAGIEPRSYLSDDERAKLGAIALRATRKATGAVGDQTV